MTGEGVPDFAQLSDIIAAAIADESDRAALHTGMRRALALSGIEADRRVDAVARIVDQIPELLRRLREALEQGDDDAAREVLQGLSDYWDQSVGVVSRSYGLVGLLDDAIVTYSVVDRLNRRSLRDDSVELVSVEGHPELDLRQLLSDEADAAVMRVVDAIWERRFDPTRVESIDPETRLFASPRLGSATPDSRLRGQQAEPRPTSAEPPPAPTPPPAPSAPPPAPSAPPPAPSAPPPAPSAPPPAPSAPPPAPRAPRPAPRASPPVEDRAGTTPAAELPPRDPRLYRVWYGTNRKPAIGGPSRGFQGRRDSSGVHYGYCDVVIPESHKWGSVGTPWLKRWIKLEFKDDRIRVEKRTASAGPDEFFAALRADLEESGGRHVLFYLHGYNVSFDAAAVRAAQMLADLKVDGEVAFFSWPSKGKLSGYPADAERVAESERAIADFLTALATRLGGATIDIIAHSMGNRGLARAIQRITAAAAHAADVKFGQIILAAPDISVELFRDLAAIYPSICQRTTMYVSARDRALEASKWYQDAPRAGFTPPVTVVPGIDTVEVTSIDLTMLGHGYFAAAAAVLYDIDELLKHNTQPAMRTRLRAGPVTDPAAPYWVIGG